MSSPGGSAHGAPVHRARDERDRAFFCRVTAFSENARRMLQEAVDKILHPRDLDKDRHEGCSKDDEAH